MAAQDANNSHHTNTKTSYVLGGLTGIAQIDLSPHGVDSECDRSLWLPEVSHQ